VRLLGIVGGISPESTIEYYRLIAAEHVPVLISSIDLDPLVAMLDRGDIGSFTDAIAAELQRLGRAGAEIALVAANTPHMVFDELQRRSPIPLVSIVEATCTEVAARGLRKPALFGTRFTMQSHFYPDDFVRPSAEEQDVIHGIYFGELVKGIFRDESRARLLAIIEAMRARHGIDSVILGGTELPLILHEAAVPLLDTTRIHVAAALRLIR
jgi:aspartate racemase